MLVVPNKAQLKTLALNKNTLSYLLNALFAYLTVANLQSIAAVAFRSLQETLGISFPSQCR